MAQRFLDEMEEEHKRRQTVDNRREESDRNDNILRRLTYFPTAIVDLDDINEPGILRYHHDDYRISRKLHWTFLCEVIEVINFFGRYHICCKDTFDQKFNIGVYFEFKQLFEHGLLPKLKPGVVIAFRYADSKMFMDGTRGIRFEDDHFEYVCAIPCSLDVLLTTGDFVFDKRRRSGDTFVCDQCGGNGEKRCSGCSTARYCNVECQKKHWPEHKQQCKLVKHVLELTGKGFNQFDLDSSDSIPFIPFPSWHLN